jgi:hypothetical protein
MSTNSYLFHLLLSYTSPSIEKTIWHQNIFTNIHLSNVSIKICRVSKIKLKREFQINFETKIIIMNEYYLFA